MSNDMTILFRAAVLGSDEEAINVWSEWITKNNLSDAPSNSIIALPLIYHRLKDKADHTLEARIGGVARQAHYRNALFESAAKELAANDR